MRTSSFLAIVSAASAAVALPGPAAAPDAVAARYLVTDDTEIVPRDRDHPEDTPEIIVVEVPDDKDKLYYPDDKGRGRGRGRKKKCKTTTLDPTATREPLFATPGFIGNSTLNGTAIANSTTLTTTTLTATETATETVTLSDDSGNGGSDDTSGGSVAARALQAVGAWFLM